MSEPNLSKAVADATNFLYSIHEDVRAMLVSLQAAMERAGWFSLPIPKKLSHNINPTLQGDWVLWWGYRLYVLKDSRDSFNRLVTVGWNLGPPEGADHNYAALVATAVRFPRLTTFDEVYNSWNSSGSVCRAALGRVGVSVLTPSDYAEFSPHASAVAAIAFPLCELTSEEMVITRLVKPILEAEAALGVQP